MGIVVAAVLEITQDALHLVAAWVQSLHVNMFFIIYTQIKLRKCS